MILNTDIYELKAKFHKLIHELDREPANVYERQLAQKYLYRALDLINEVPLI